MDVLLGTGTQLLAAAGEGGHGTSWWGFVAYLVGLLVALFFVLSIAKSGLKDRIFKNFLTQAAEQAYLFVEQLAVGIIGPHGRRYVPMMFVFWTVIFIGNLMALFLPTSPTADLSFNLGMALISIGYVQWEGIKANGFFGHLAHFSGPRLGGMMVIVSGMIFIIELISETMKNVSLSLRLYGNIEGGHMVTDALSKIGAKLVEWNGYFFGFPFGALLLPIKLMTVLIQALIFTLLTCVYISLVTHHEEHGDGKTAHAH